jgi:D-alanyl-D-alanine carboxypeptidase
MLANIAKILYDINMKKQIAIIVLLTTLLVPNVSFALQMPQSTDQLIQNQTISAPAYAVMDLNTGRILLEKNSTEQRIPASLTKLVTIMVVMDRKPKLSKTVTMTKKDMLVGECKHGGVCLNAKPGTQFTVDTLLHATLIRSANDAASALSRSTGLSEKQFVAKMNAKIKSLGATHSRFVEPTGMNPLNTITAADYAKVLKATFSNNYLREIAQLQNYNVVAANNPSYNQNLKNADKLIGLDEITLLGAKTGYLTESKYNFATIVKQKEREELAVVILGEDHLWRAFDETKTLAHLAQNIKDLEVALK